VSLDTRPRDRRPPPPHGCGLARAAIAWSGAVLLALCAGCAGLPELPERPAEHALAPATEGSIAHVVGPLVAQHPGLTGVVSLGDAQDAFATRVALARRATRSIDIQTFIWHADATGTLMFEEVLRAAERGVRVRLLLDDVNTSKGLDRTLALLASNPNLELRLYNPFVVRGTRAWGFLTDFTRVNHRMHNKAFTVDNLATIIGGRNIADEYFAVGEGTGFIDLDVMAVGHVVQAVSAQFDLYWNSASAYPSRTILAQVEPEPREALAERARVILDSPGAARYGEEATRLPVVRSLLDGTLAPEWAQASVVFDDPSKTQNRGSEWDLLMLPKLLAEFGKPLHSLDMISPYFVPGDAGTEALATLARGGVRVRVMTNSLAATDEKSVHAGYVKRREALLRAGVELLELKPEGMPVRSKESDIGSSKAGLHAKTYAVDRREIFVGSFNFDPRSARLNTELGVVFESAVLATRLATVIDGAYPAAAYRLALGDDGQIRWFGADGQVFDTDPGTSWWDRMVVRIGSWLPIEWLL
jgi:putative cardiolipin synthase